MANSPLYRALQSYQTGLLAVDARHQIYWEQSGNPAGQPALFIHGGPGSGTHPGQRQFFDPAHYRIVLFDQRGCGRSQPIADITDNTSAHLIADIEQLRESLGIDRWLVFGGSWGSSLGLAYAQAHPERCSALIVRGVWLCRPDEIDWWLYGTQRFFPEVWRRFMEFLPECERHEPLAAYHRRLIDPDPKVHMPAAAIWKSYELSMVRLQHTGFSDFGSSPRTLAMSRIMAHYLTNGCFFGDNELLANAYRIKDLPGVIVQGRYDMICPPASADELSRAWPKARYQIVNDAGHDAMEAGTALALVRATDDFRHQTKPG